MTGDFIYILLGILFYLVESIYTSVKIRVKAKKKLEELQARLRLYGVKAGLHDVLEKLIELGFDEEDVLLRKFKPAENREDPMLRLLEKPLDWNVKDASVKIDETLYGGGSGDIHRHGNIRSSKK